MALNVREFIAHKPNFLVLSILDEDDTLRFKAADPEEAVITYVNIGVILSMKCTN